ncbi:Nose resistant to fluoxetine protein 6 [Eumeta japonica]|uniref:Nose resistant to fluoxetine protein 6 n=1 Tax=Eumeta variegata TaxID=151549 RepID=A0A4C1U3L4_EUMVA|nr:Nose resistant to fluoxetine protein 6 [Eumeta japonica]
MRAHSAVSELSKILFDVGEEKCPEVNSTHYTELPPVFVSVSGCSTQSDQVLLDAKEDSSVIGRNLFDQDLYENSLDSELCDRQLSLLFANVTHALPFLDAGMRLPRGILEGNLVDLGNYHQCLAIRQQVEDTTVEGKYCSITIPLDQQANVLELLSLGELPLLSEELLNKIKEYALIKKEIQILTQSDDGNFRISDDLSIFSVVGITLAFCIPKSCSTQQALGLLADKLEFTENYCRLPGDKMNTPADYVTLSIFSLIGILVLVSTCYDLVHSFFLKKDPKEKSTLYSSFSVYTNTQRLLTFKAGADSLDCLDGIRAITIFWVIVGHTHSTAALFPIQNPLSVLEVFKCLLLVAANAKRNLDPISSSKCGHVPDDERSTLFVHGRQESY